MTKDIQLFDYQEDMVKRVQEAFKHHDAVMVQMPTGTGKTYLLAALVGLFLKEEVWVVAHRRELVSQIKDTLERFFSSLKTTSIKVTSIQWLSRHYGEMEEKPGLIVIDEAHHALAETYAEVMNAYPKAKKLGLTATPYRLNGKGFTDLFDTLLCSWSMEKFIAEGRLSLYDYYSIKPDSTDQQLIDSLQKRGADGDYQQKELNEVMDVKPSLERLCLTIKEYVPGKKGIVYAISIQHAEHIAEFYRENGIKAVAISSKTPLAERQELIERFKSSSLSSSLNSTSDDIEVLVSVDLFSEGFDCPDVEFIQMARPTLSLAKYLQMVGRGLRVHEGKVCCTIIDNVGLYRRFGLPSGERNWGMYFGGLKDERMKELNNLSFDLNHNSGSFRKEGDAALVKIVGHEGMAARFERLGRAGFERKKKDVLLSGKRKKVWVWVDTLTGITFERNPVAVDFKGVEMMTDDGLTFYPRIRSKWVDGKSGINRKTLETQVGDGFGWMKRYVSLYEPDKVYELQEVMAGGMRVYKDEKGKTFFQQDLDSPLVSKEEAGGKKAFMVLCEARKEEWKAKVWESRRNCFVHVDATTGAWCLDGGQAEKDGEFYRIVDRECWFDGNTGFVYHHRPVVRYRGFVKLVYDGDLVYIMNIHEERFIAYHNWEIRADDGICTIGNKLYLKRNKDGKALWIRKRSGDFQMFVVNEPMMVEDSQKRPLTIDVQMMIINKYGKEVEKKRIKEQDTKTKLFGV